MDLEFSINSNDWGKNMKGNGMSLEEGCPTTGNIFFEKPSNKKASLCKNKGALRKEFEEEMKFNGRLMMTQHSEISFQEKRSNQNSAEKPKFGKKFSGKREPEILLSYGEFMEAISKEILTPDAVTLTKDKHLIMEYLFKLTS
jgi:hypothetical protein